MRFFFLFSWGEKSSRSVSTKTRFHFCVYPKSFPQSTFVAICGVMEFPVIQEFF